METFVDAATEGICATEGEGRKVSRAFISTSAGPRQRDRVSYSGETGKVDGALQVLIQNLDPLQTLCRTDWAQGEEIDVFFYRLKNAGSEAKAPMQMVYSILVVRKRRECGDYSTEG